jgi:hypothetical protein
VKNKGKIDMGDHCMYVKEFCIPILRNARGSSARLQKEDYCPMGDACHQQVCCQLRKVRNGSVTPRVIIAQNSMNVQLQNDIVVPPRTGIDLRVAPSSKHFSDRCQRNDWVIAPENSVNSVAFGRTVVKFDDECETIMPCMNVGD